MTRSRYDYGSEGTATQNFIPDTDNAYDLGSSSYEFKDLYIDGTANIDALVADTADINGGTIDGVTIGTNSACTQLVVDNIGINGNTISSSSGNIILLPVAGSITVIGDAGSTSHSLAANDDLLVTGQLEVDGNFYADTNVSSPIVEATSYAKMGTTYWRTGTTAGLGYTSTNNSLVWTSYDNRTKNHGKSSQSHPTIYVHSSTDPTSDATEWSSLTWDTFTLGGDNGSRFTTTKITEEVTIPVGEGNTPTVTSSSNLAPANSIIRAIAVRVTQAPGGGATVVSVGRTNGGNTDEFIDDISTALNTTGNSVANNDGVLAAEDMWNASADTFEITTDGDVTGIDMKLRIVVWYEQITAPTS